MRIFKPIIAGVFCAAFTLNAAAHDTWLAGASANATEARFALSTGSEFPKLGEANNAARLLRSVVMGDSQITPLLVENTNAKALMLKSALPKTGTYTAIVQTKPNSIELDQASVREYFKELGASKAVQKRYATQKRWRELYAKNAKLLLRTDAKASADSWLKPTNLPYEFVPSVDPTSLNVGDQLPVCAYADGKPVPKAYIGIIDAKGNASFKTADKNGCVKFKLTEVSGYLVRGVYLQETDLPDLEWLSHFAALTVFDTTKN